MSETMKWTRARFQPNLPLGENRTKVTESEEHLALARRAGREGKWREHYICARHQSGICRT